MLQARMARKAWGGPRERSGRARTVLFTSVLWFKRSKVASRNRRARPRRWGIVQTRQCYNQHGNRRVVCHLLQQRKGAVVCAQQAAVKVRGVKKAANEGCGTARRGPRRLRCTPGVSGFPPRVETVPNPNRDRRPFIVQVQRVGAWYGRIEPVPPQRQGMLVRQVCSLHEVENAGEEGERTTFGTNICERWRDVGCVLGRGGPTEKGLRMLQTECRRFFFLPVLQSVFVRVCAKCAQCAWCRAAVWRCGVRQGERPACSSTVCCYQK